MTISDNLMITMTKMGKAIEKGLLKTLSHIFKVVIQLL